MSSMAAEPLSIEAERNELQAVLESQLFVRSPALAHLLSYLCEKQFTGQTAQLKEYSIALDVFDRHESFDQDNDSIVRVQANRLRKRLADYYAADGRDHPIRITIPLGQYIPAFEAMGPVPAPGHASATRRWRKWLPLGTVIIVVAAAALAIYLVRQKPAPPNPASAPTSPRTAPEPMVGLPVGDEVRILAGSARSYVDRSGKQWSSDVNFAGGSVVRTTVQHIWRTQDPNIYRTSRQGDFTYDIPLKRGVYELRLHFAETYYGPEDEGGGGEGSRVMNITMNGKPLLNNFDVIADSEGGRTAEVKVFIDVSPASDGYLHLGFTSSNGGRAMVSAIEVLPGTHGHIRPVRIVARDVPYYSNDSHWWSADNYFKGGQLASSEETANGTDDPELYETERWGHFSYSIPVTPGQYTLVFHFIERRFHSDRAQGTEGPSGGRVFNVFCNGKAIVRNLSILDEVGENRPLVRKITGLEPNAQGKLLLEFVPVNHYATVSAIEVVPQ